MICPSVLLRRPVTGAYITYITDPRPFTAVIEMTALVDPAELGGHTLVYLPRYTDPDDPAFDATDAELRPSSCSRSSTCTASTSRDVCRSRWPGRAT